MNVALCRTNLMRLGPAATAAIREACARSGVKPEIRPCLDRCATCPTAALALVDGSLVGASTAQELAEAIAALAP